MKTKILSAIVFISLIFYTSCNWIDSGLNVDPTAPLDASLNVILPTVQAGMAYSIGGDINRFSSLFTQHVEGIDRQHLGLYQYNFKEDDLDNCWTSMYTGPMEDIYIIIGKAKANGSPHYQGIAEVLMAVSLDAWTDILGDIPYSECFQGAGKLKPKYDSQQSIYNSMIALLDSALVHLAAVNSNFKPGADDFIYGGDLTLWIKAAKVLKARLYLHLKDYTNAAASLNGGLASHTEDMQFTFGTKETEANPWYQFITQRGDIRIGPKLVELMNDLTDPRRPAYMLPGDTLGNYIGGVSELGPMYTEANSPVPFVTYMEAKFIEAECLLNTNKTKAYEAYLEGITASCRKASVADAEIVAFLASPKVNVGANNLTLQNIIEQKYIALFTMAETWVDWRRTNFPALTPVTGTSVPRRYFYPQSERLYNLEELQKADGYSNSPQFIYSKMWLDRQW
jgi:hypothetical protein